VLLFSLISFYPISLDSSFKDDVVIKGNDDDLNYTRLLLLLPSFEKLDSDLLSVSASNSLSSSSDPSFSSKAKSNEKSIPVPASLSSVDFSIHKESPFYLLSQKHKSKAIESSNKLGPSNSSSQSSAAASSSTSVTYSLKFSQHSLLYTEYFQIIDIWFPQTIKKYPLVRHKFFFCFYYLNIL
jgi:hypothetical protein